MSFLVLPCGIPHYKNEFRFSPLQSQILNKMMPKGFKIEKHSVLKRYIQKKKEEVPLKKPKLSSVSNQ